MVCGLWGDRITKSSLPSVLADKWRDSLISCFIGQCPDESANVISVSCVQRRERELCQQRSYAGWVCPCICKNSYCEDYACWARKESMRPNPDLNCTCAAPKAVGLHPGSAHGLMRSCMIANNVDGTLESKWTTVPCFAVLSALQHLFCFIIF